MERSDTFGVVNRPLSIELSIVNYQLSILNASRAVRSILFLLDDLLAVGGLADGDLDEGGALAQERVAARAVHDGEGGREAGDDRLDEGGFHLLGRGDPFGGDEAVAEGAETHQLHLVAFLEVGDDVALVTVEDVQHVALGERRLLGDLFRRIVGREDTVIVRRRFVHFLPGRFPGDKILTR